MTTRRAESLVVQSLMDRLSRSFDMPTDRKGSLKSYEAGVKRDIEWLLNTRKPMVPEIEKYKLAADSVFNFGLPDMTQLRATDPNAVRTAILDTLRVHETRIRDPQVRLVRSDELARSLRFHVDGILMHADGEEEIAFDTVLEITSGMYEVK